MSVRITGIVGLLLMAFYTLFLATKIGSMMLLAIVAAVIAMAAIDVWQEGWGRNGEG
jgi:hypothetical protein